ncbi:MAG: VOC family protein [Pseudomonadota bacterium]
MSIGVLDHVSIPVRDIKRSGAFYDAVLAVLGLYRTGGGGDAIGYGTDPDVPCSFWILEQTGANAAMPGLGLHISFSAFDRAQVHAFHAAALAHGGRDAGQPGPRPQYSSGFYGAFVFDPDDTKIEAVVRKDLI